MDFNIQNQDLIDEIGPEKIIYLRDPTTDMNAVLVIDNSVYGIPAGGVRLAPDITVDEMIRLSRAMTYKFCTYRMKVGGAKAGIWGDPRDLETKGLLITSFGDAIEKFILNDVYYPGPDMGTDDADMLKIFNVIGKPNLAPKPLGMKKNGVPVEELFTGYGLVYCLEVFYDNIDKFSKGEIDKTKKPKVILEGFGKVGTAVAMALNELGYTLTGISTIEGAIYDEEGLDINKLLDLKEKYGDKLVKEYESKNLITVPKEKLFELSSQYKTDFIIPGARPDVINKNNVDKIDVKAIVPGANIPYAEGVTDILKQKGIVAFPDFVANAGEILAIWVNKVAKNADEIFDFIKQKIGDKTMNVIQGAMEKNITPYEFAVNDALNEFQKKLKRKNKRIKKLNKRF
ncbi:MAG: hypothetical protein GF383_10590 [Candidatus Lokiarchaeota archaeon]|nr:hypothetical protein [Candidatus Lokiarchaeota archaeon]MBD3341020.1 hypothetical protein [Candidatus Lokiarchaeota archaeon]